MAVVLLRRQSDTPTVQGSDDSRILRYAVAGYSGITKGYANECGYEISGAQFKIKSGEIIVDGWQAIIDSMGINIQTNSSSTKLFYTVYIEYDLRSAENQHVMIKSSYDTGSHPIIQPGDDLTQNPYGIRRMVLYNFTSQNNVISSVSRIASYCIIGHSVYSETAPLEDSSNKIATTEFVKELLSSKRILVADYGESGSVSGKIEGGFEIGGIYEVVIDRSSYFGTYFVQVGHTGNRKIISSLGSVSGIPAVYQEDFWLKTVYLNSRISDTDEAKWEFSEVYLGRKADTTLVDISVFQSSAWVNRIYKIVRS